MPAVLPDQSRIEELCSAHGLRLTGPRRVIARVLSGASDHPDVEEVFRRASAIEPKLALSTVYRTVKLFTDHGLLECHDFGPGPMPRTRIEQASGHHHDHLIDTKTGEVIEFYSAEIEALQVRIARELGFDLISHRLELYGTRTLPSPKRPA